MTPQLPIFSLALPFLSAAPLALAQGQGGPTQLVTNSSLPSSTGDFGEVVVNVADFNLDGYEDYAVAAPLWNNGVGRAYVYSGRDGTLLLEVDGDQAADRSFGTGIQAIGDVNGDGQPDICLSSPDYDAPGAGNESGRVACFSGTSGTLLWEHFGELAQGHFGQALGALAPAGLESTISIAVGQPGYTGTNGTGVGRVVFLDPATGLSQGDQEGTAGFDGLGASIATRPGTGLIYSSSLSGRVWSLSFPGQPPTLFTEANPGNNSPPDMAILFDSSGPCGLAVGRPFDDPVGAPNGGRVIYYANFNVPGIVIAEGSSIVEFVGESLTEIRDFDGDGIDEIGFTSKSTVSTFDKRLRILTTSAELLLDTEITSGVDTDLTSINDTTGDGLGEWIAGISSSGAATYEARLFSQGLELEAETSIADGSLLYQFSIDMGSAHAHAPYVQLYGGSGAQPGFVFNTGAPRVPLNMDAITNVVLGASGSPAFPNVLGTLDSNGQQQTAILLSPTIVTALSGLSLDTAAVVLSTSPLGAEATSNPLRFTLP